MKVLITADARSVHTRRWAVSLKAEGVDIVLYSIFPSPDAFFEEHGIRLYVFDLFTYKQLKGVRSVISMISRHREAVRYLRSVIDSESPDILHAHYATSFGLIAALSGFHPFIISVWGSDVYEFPEKSFLNRESVKFIMRRADSLIRAFKIVMERNPRLRMSLVIVGDGPCRKEYEDLAAGLGISGDVKFIGKVRNDLLSEYYNSFSVAVSLSDSESFGVVAVEAMACECPVVVSDADGFTEVVEDGVTGFIVPRRNPEAAAAAIQKFIDNPRLREKMGAAGRARVSGLYDWKDNVALMIDIYSEVSNG